MTNETKIESGGNLRTETAVAKQVARYQPLFDLLYQEHGIAPLESEMQEIINVALATRAPQQAAGDDQICKCAASSGNWFDRTISHRSDGTEGMAYVCNDCGNEVSTAGEDKS